MKIAALIVCWGILLGLFGRVGAPGLFRENTAMAAFWSQWIAFVTIVALSIVLMVFIERGEIKTVLSVKAGRDILLGLLVGTLWIGGTLILLLITDSLQLGEWQAVPGIAWWILSVVANVGAQEYFVHGYAFSLLQTRYGNITATAVTALIYAVLNVDSLKGGTIAILIIFAASILLSLVRIYTGGLLAPFLIHLIWNGVGGFVLGCVNLGGEYPVVWQALGSGIDFISGGSLRFEGSGLALIVSIVLIDLLAIMMNDKRKRRI